MIKRTEKGQFAKGHSGNRQGKPKGARNKTTLAVLELIDDNSLLITETLMEKALDGDITALKLCIDRIAPPMKEMPISAIELPMLTGSESVLTSLSIVTQKLCNGELLPSQAKAVSNMLDTYQKQLDLEKLKERVENLEKASHMDFNSFYDDIKNNHSDDLR